MTALTRRDALAALAAAPAVRAAAAPLTLPALLNDFHQIWILARINGSPVLWCELDSGGGGALYFIDAQKAAALGIRAERTGQSAGPGQQKLAPDGRATVTVEFPGLRLERQELVIKPAPLGKDGIVALANFRQWVTELDFETPAVRLHDAAAFRYSGPGAALPLAFVETNPLLEVRLQFGATDEVRGRFVVDTGAAGSIAYLTSSFFERARIAKRNCRWAPDSLGLSAARITGLAAGPLAIEQPVIRRFPAPGFGGTAEPDGLLGVEFLRRFRLFFDYGRERLILEPNAAYRDPSRFDASGLRVYKEAPDRHGLKIFAVLPETPAAEAGVREGDVLLAVDGTSAELVPPSRIAEMLMDEGSERTLLLERGAQVLSLKLKLRRLL